jgi:hypothetical protein
METTPTEELLFRARTLMQDLEGLRALLEGSMYRPEVKSALARDLVESQARVDAVVRACVPLV